MSIAVSLSAGGVTLAATATGLPAVLLAVGTGCALVRMAGHLLGEGAVENEPRALMTRAVPFFVSRGAPLAR